MKPRLLDICCGGGGAGVGYARAGFDVVGLDIADHRRYPFALTLADASDVTVDFVRDFDAVHASPPCQRWTRRSNADNYPDLITPLRDLFVAAGVPYVIENVPSAPLRQPRRLCGSSFGLRVRRHRLFETSFEWDAPDCEHEQQGDDFITVAGGGPNPNSFRRGPRATGGPDRKPRNLEDAADAMGVDWPMTRKELNESIPPAYTEYIGNELRQAKGI